MPVYSKWQTKIDKAVADARSTHAHAFRDFTGIEGPAIIYDPPCRDCHYFKPEIVYKVDPAGGVGTVPVGVKLCWRGEEDMRSDFNCFKPK